MESLAPASGGQVQPHPREKRDQARAMFLAGKPPVDIAYEMQLPAATIRAWASRENWKEHKQVADAVPALNAETCGTLARVLVQTIEQTEPTNLELEEKQTEYAATMGDIALRIARHVATLEPEKMLAAADKVSKWDGVNRKALKMESDTPRPLVQIALLSTPTEKQLIVSSNN